MFIMKKKNGYYKNRHSCFLLQYHLVLITKYRHPVIKGNVEYFLKEYITNYFEERNCPILAFEMMPDHIHLLFEAGPQINLAEFINAFKSASSRMVRKNFPNELKEYYWKPYFWSLSYFVGTVNEKTTSIVENYIKNQKNK